jgi:hypothetical protein
MARKPKPPAAAAPPALPYPVWRAAVAALLEEPLTMAERELVKLHVRGKAPAEAAAEADTHSRNARKVFRRK